MGVLHFQTDCNSWFQHKPSDMGWIINKTLYKKGSRKLDWVLVTPIHATVALGGHGVVGLTGRELLGPREWWGPSFPVSSVQNCQIHTMHRGLIHKIVYNQDRAWGVQFPNSPYNKTSYSLHGTFDGEMNTQMCLESVFSHWGCNILIITFQFHSHF